MGISLQFYLITNMGPKKEIKNTSAGETITIDVKVMNEMMSKIDILSTDMKKINTLVV